ncbi:MAG: nitric oxide synthase oxygenase [Planctomycetota bacterium]
MTSQEHQDTEQTQDAHQASVENITAGGQREAVHDQNFMLLKQTLQSLFTQLPLTRLQPLLDLAVIRSPGSGQILMSEGESATELFVLLSGRCGIYTQDAERRLCLIETVSTPGTLLGEQSFLQGRQFRSASVLMLEPSEVAILPGKEFRELLAADPQVSQQLSSRAIRYALNKLGVLAAELSQLADPSTVPQGAVRQVAAGAAIYQAGAPAECAWFLLAGEVSLTQQGSSQPSESLRAGLLFGQSEVLTQEPRRETATALTSVEVLSIDAAVLRSCQQQGGQLGTILTALASAHRLPQLGTVYRYLAHVDREPCIVSDYSLSSGMRVRVHYFPQLPRLDAARQESAAGTVTLSSPDHSRLLLLTARGVLTGLTVTGDWEQLPAAMSLVLRSGSLADWQQRAFQSTGELLLENAASRTPAGAEVICACTNATAAMLRAAARTATTVEDLTRMTGAGGICGGCKARLPLFLGEMELHLCRLHRESLAAGAIRVRLESIVAGTLPAARAGQFIRIEALIDGTWIGRPYTLIGWNPNEYELGVKLEHKGFFSNWLSSAPSGTLLRVFPPAGDVCPLPTDPRPLVYIVAGIGVTPAIAGLRTLASSRNTHVLYSFRTAQTAACLEELRTAATAGRILLREHCTATEGRLTPTALLALVQPLGPAEVIVCGPGEFNRMAMESLAELPGVTIRADSFDHPQRGEGLRTGPGAWRKKGFVPTCPAGPPIPLKTSLPADAQAEQFLREFHAECPGRCDPEQRISAAREELAETGVWHKTTEELGFAAQVAWRNAERCVGRLYWKGLHLRDCRNLTHPDHIADALFEHLRFAWNQGDLRPAITVFSPGTRHVPGPRIWNPQLLRYAGFRLRSGRQVGDPAQNAVTERIRQLGWEPAGTDFDLLPLVVETAEYGPRLYELPADCRYEVPLSHPQHAWLATRSLKWYAVPAVADMALDAGGVMYRFAPFNGWYLNTEIAARNLTDINRYNLLPELAERLGLDISSERTLWRDRTMLMLHEAVLHSFDRAGVKMADHHTVCHEFLEFCRNEQSAGREPAGRWMWLVPPFSSSATVLYQEPFRDLAFKPAYRLQKPVWEKGPLSETRKQVGNNSDRREQ